MNLKVNLKYLISFVFTLSLLAGCGAPPKISLIPVNGIVKINGEPAEGIMVMFVFQTSDENIATASSQALSGPNGEFTLVSLKTNEPGAMEGTHVVTLLDTLEDRPAQGQVAQTRSRLAPHFGTKGIEVTVVAGQDITIEAKGP